MFNAKKYPELFGMPFKYADEPSKYMQNKYNLTPSGEPIVKEQHPNFNPLEEKLKKEVVPTRSGGSGAAGSGLDIEGKTGRNIKPKLKAGGKVIGDRHGFGKSSTGKHKHGF